MKIIDVPKDAIFLLEIDGDVSYNERVAMLEKLNGIIGDKVIIVKRDALTILQPESSNSDQN